MINPASRFVGIRYHVEQSEIAVAESATVTDISEPVEVSTISVK